MHRRQLLAATALGAGVAWLSKLPAHAADVTVPPPSGGDDTNAIRDAIGAAGAGGTLSFQSGEYRVSGLPSDGIKPDAALRPLPGQIWIGAGTSNTKLLAVQQAVRLISARGNFALADLSLDLNRQNLPPPSNPNFTSGLESVRAGNLSVQGCRIVNAYGRGIRFVGGSSPDGAVSILNCRVSYNLVEGIHVNRCADMEIRNCRTGVNGNGVWVGLSVFSGTGTVDDLVTNGNTRHGVVFVRSQHWEVANSSAHDNGAWGILAGGVNQPDYIPNHTFTIQGNTSENNVGGGISLDPTTLQEPDLAQRQDAKVLNNICTNANETHGINLTHCYEVLVQDNTCTHNARNGIQVSNSGRVTALGNECAYNTRYGMRVTRGDVTNGCNHMITKDDNNCHDNGPGYADFLNECEE